DHDLGSHLARHRSGPVRGVARPHPGRPREVAGRRPGPAPAGVPPAGPGLARRSHDQLAPGLRCGRPAAPHRPGHGLLRLLDRGGARRRVGLGARRPAGDLGRARPGGHVGGAAAAVGVPPPLVADRPGRGGGPAAAGPDPRHRGEAQRRPAVVRPRLRPLPAVGGGEADLRAVGRARPRPAGALPDDVVAADPGAAGVRRPLAADHRRTGLRRRHGPGPGAGRPPLGRWHAAALLRLVRRRRSGGRGDPGEGRPVPHGPHHGVPRPVRRPHRGRLPGDPRDVRAGHRRAVGRRAGQQRDEVEPAAARRVRLHLRDHRRGAGLPRLPGRRHPLRRARLRRLPDRASLRRPVRPAGQRGHHGLAGRPGRHEHGLRGRSAPGHRRDAAARLRRWDVAGAHAVHRRPPGPLRPLGTGRHRVRAQPAARPPRPASPARAGGTGRPGPAAPPAGGPRPPPSGRGQWAHGRA
ncbi:MAG: Cell division protein FtsW, partial [uncultured Blastococcus sp.]